MHGNPLIGVLTIVNKVMFVPLAATRLAEREDALIGKLVKSGYYLNVSEFIREAVREKLAKIGEMKIVVVKKTTKEKAKKEIVSYFKGHPGAYVSEAADALGIDVVLAFETVNELVEEDKLWSK